MSIITLTTDFGTTDWFAGSMKGVILGINPAATVVDIAHDLPGGDVRAGAFALMAACRSFPHRTIHVAVVDPGVGSRRAAIMVRTADYDFVGPDNGVLSLALAREKIDVIHKLENDLYFQKPVSQTFHGRDIFAPVAAHLSLGLSTHMFGRKVRQFRKLAWPKPKKRKRTFRGQVIYVDRFGNAITNLEGEILTKSSGKPWRVSFQGKDLGPIRSFYQEVKQGQALGLIGSSGFLEIAANGGNTAREPGLQIGDAVLLF